MEKGNIPPVFYLLDGGNEAVQDNAASFKYHGFTQHGLNAVILYEQAGKFYFILLNSGLNSKIEVNDIFNTRLALDANEVLIGFYLHLTRKDFILENRDIDGVKYKKIIDTMAERIGTNFAAIQTSAIQTSAIQTSAIQTSAIQTSADNGVIRNGSIVEGFL